MAMRARGRDSRSGAQWAPIPDSHCWLVVARWGSDGEYLSIGHAGRADLPELPPIGLAPSRTCLGILEPRRLGRTMPPRFLLQARPPPRLELAGTFIPASGVVLLSDRRSLLRMSLFGRFGRGSRSWTVDAVRVPWIGEAIDRG